MASAIIARMPTASMISSSVNAPRPRILTRSINIKFDLARLQNAVAGPFRGESDQTEVGQLQAFLVFQSGGDRFLRQLHLAKSRLDFIFLGLIRLTRCG